MVEAVGNIKNKELSDAVQKLTSEFEERNKKAEYIIRELKARVKGYEDAEKVTTIINNVTGSLKDLTDRIVNEINKGEVSEKSKTAARELRQKAQDYEDASKILAKKVINTLKPPLKPEPPDIVKEMVRTLFQVAKENKLVPEKQPMTKRKLIEIVGKAVKMEADYRDVWVKAQEIVKKKFGKDEKALTILDNYFKHYLENPWSEKEVSSVVKTGLKEMEVNLSDIVKKHFSVVDEAKETLTDKLLKEADLDTFPKGTLGTRDSDAPGNEELKNRIDGFAKTIKEDFDKKVEERKRKILESRLDIKPKEAKKLYEKIIELSNLGALDFEDYRQLFAQKYKMKFITDEQSKEIIKRANKVQ